MSEIWEMVDTGPIPLMEAGEDRSFGGSNTLYIDLLPHSSHGKTLQNLLSPKDFAKLKCYVLARAHSKCECCGAPATVCHPRFQYNHHRLVQKLRRLMAMCSECKRSTHMGVAQIKGERSEALCHLQQVWHACI
jgi:hypothetical protein